MATESRPLALESPYVTIFNTAAVAMAQVSLSGEFLLVNPAFARLVGYTPAELVGMTFQQITHGDDLDDDLTNVTALLDGHGGDYAMDKRYIRKDGAETWVRLSVSLARDSHGEPDYYVAVVERIDDRMAVEAELARLRARINAVFEAVPVGISIAELPSTRMIASNGYLEAMLRHPVTYGDTEAYNASLAFHENGTRVQREDYPLARMARGEEAPSIDINYRRGDGTFSWIRVIGRPVRSETGEITHGVIVAWDIDAEKKAWDRIRHEVDELQSQLIHTSRISAMGLMASALAHELNQPLTAAANYMSATRRILDRAGPSQDLDQARDAVVSAEASALRAGEIIRRLREMLARGEVTRQSLVLADLVKEAVAIALVSARDRELKLVQEVDPAIRVFANGLQVQQVLLNLIRNCVEALEGVAKPEVRIVAKSAGEFVELGICDNGSGIPEAVRNRIFEPFVSTKQAGMGVGLAICRTIVEAHGGSIRLDHEAENGAHIVFTLPAA